MLLFNVESQGRTSGSSESEYLVPSRKKANVNQHCWLGRSPRPTASPTARTAATAWTATWCWPPPGTTTGTRTRSTPLETRDSEVHFNEKGSCWSFQFKLICLKGASSTTTAQSPTTDTDSTTTCSIIKNTILTHYRFPHVNLSKKACTLSTTVSAR